MPQHLFFLGKGGVGKSTLSAIEGLKSAELGKNCLIVSMDPAHNQSDIFQESFSEHPKNIGRNLQVIEINLKKQIKKYLADIESKLKQTYRYLTAFNLENHFDIIQYSPGIEEYALLLAYDNITNAFNDKDIIIFDMPPTALTFKFFNLPNISLLWLEKLLTLRKQIIEKKQIITKIKIGKKDIETDKITKNLLDQFNTYKKVNKNLQNSKITQIILVMNPDILSINESIKIWEQLQSIKLDLDRVIINKYQNQNKTDFKRFNNKDIQYFPLNPDPLIGIDNLIKYLTRRN